MQASKPPITLEELSELVEPNDSVVTGLATGQAIAALETIGSKAGIEKLDVYCGLMAWPYSFLQRPEVRVLSGFFGPVERQARADGSSIEYLPADFIGLEQLALRVKPRIVVAPTTMPDAEGFVSFGLHSGALDRAFREAAADPSRLAIAEANPRVPRLGGAKEFGDHRINIADLDAWVVNESDPLALPTSQPSEEEVAIAKHAAALIRPGATLQFGIGAIPNTIARILAERDGGDYSIHSEMISDGVMHLHRAGKVSNRKSVYPGVTVATFALGSSDFYRWLDGNPDVKMMPVSAVNDAAIIRRLDGFVSVNTGLAVDLFGQVAADHIAGRQYSGIGGHEAFIAAATEAPDGRSLLCLKATAKVQGETVSSIVSRIPADALVTTPRQHLDFVVTEYGSVEVFALGDRSRARAIVSVAHPDFREPLLQTLD